jgi:hypothetical protein
LVGTTLGDSLRRLWRVESTNAFDWLLLIVLLIVLCGRLLEIWLHVEIPVLLNGCCDILDVTLVNQERRFLVKRWQQTKAPKPSRKQPAVVGSGT